MSLGMSFTVAQVLAPLRRVVPVILMIVVNCLLVPAAAWGLFKAFGINDVGAPGGDPPRNQPSAPARTHPGPTLGLRLFRPTGLSMLPSVLRQSVSVLGQEGPMVCFCGPAGHRGNAPRAMARWRPTRDVECQLKFYCGRRIPGHDPLSASRVAGGRPIGGPAP